MHPEPILPEAPAIARCVNCGNHEAVGDHPTKLCAGCRQAFIRYPIPKKLLFFAALIGLVMIAGLVRMPKYLTAGIHMGRGQKAMEQHRYHTAARELDLVLQKVPSSLEAHADKLIASCYNMDPAGIQSASNFLEGKKIEDDDLYNELQTAMNFVQPLYEQDTPLNRVLSQPHTEAELLQLAAGLDTFSRDPALPRYFIADKLFDVKAYGQAEKLLQSVLAANDRLYPALFLMAAVKREQGQYDAALSYCDRMLAINREDIGGQTLKAKIELKRHHDEAAQRYADEAMRLDPHDVRSLEAKALTTYFSGKGAESRRLLAQLEQLDDDTAKTVYRRTQDVLNGTKSYR